MLEKGLRLMSYFTAASLMLSPFKELKTRFACDCLFYSFFCGGRKKKLTDHWRKFIQPIMWRCKWVELKIKELQNQAQMYDKEVKETSQAKQLELENLKSEEVVGVKALPRLPCHTQKTQLKKRHKRKRVEEASDAPSNALNHNLFSYHGMVQVFCYLVHLPYLVFHLITPFVSLFMFLFIAYRKFNADTALNDNSRKLGNLSFLV